MQLISSDHSSFHCVSGCRWWKNPSFIIRCDWNDGAGVFDGLFEQRPKLVAFVLGYLVAVPLFNRH